MQRQAQCDAATSGFLFIPKAGAAMTSKFGGVWGFFPSFFFFLLQSSLERVLPVPVQESVAKETITVICLALFGCYYSIIAARKTEPL